MSFELPGGPYGVTAARLALSDLDAKLEPSIAFDVRLLVSELVTNSVKHAGVSEDDSIVLEVDIRDDSVVHVEVRDHGPGFERPSASPPDEADEGWGLFLVEQLADKWDVDSERRAVWFEIDCAKRAGDADSESESTAA